MATNPNPITDVQASIDDTIQLTANEAESLVGEAGSAINTEVGKLDPALEPAVQSVTAGGVSQVDAVINKVEPEVVTIANDDFATGISKLETLWGTLEGWAQTEVKAIINHFKGSAS